MRKWLACSKRKVRQAQGRGKVCSFSPQYRHISTKGIAHLYKKEVARAKKTFDEALQIRRKIPSTSSMQEASSTYCLGASYYYSNDYSHALLLFQECLKVYIKESGEESPIVAQTLYWTGKQYAKLSKPGKALEFLLSALRILKKDKATTDYSVVVSLLHSIGLVYEQDAVSSPEMALKCKMSHFYGQT